MPTIERSALLPYPADQIYQLINDIEAYPQFMKGCVGAEILSRDENCIEARLDLQKAGIKQSFTTRNRMKPPSVIDMELVDGPFSDFSGQWQVLALNDVACKVTVTLSFALSNRVVAATAGALFNPVADNLVDALVKRANELYGR
jgi:ribosome-associated toxin RatA of RatAB toxin-antitoxin module